MLIAVKNHALPVYKKNRIASLLCIFESTIACCIGLKSIITHEDLHHNVNVDTRNFAILGQIFMKFSPKCKAKEFGINYTPFWEDLLIFSNG